MTRDEAINEMMTREQILDALSTFANQRPGFDPCNYGTAADYRRDSRSATRDLRDFRALLTQVRWRATIGVEQLRAAFRAYSGRLSLHAVTTQHTAETCPGRPCSTECDHLELHGVRLEYCTGQYFPTEFRKAACAVLSAALWEYYRTQCMPPVVRQDSKGVDLYPSRQGKKRDIPAGDWLREAFKREFGAQLARRWFD